MKTMVVSELKAKCIAVLREAQFTGEAVLITRRGRPLARVEPLGEGATERRLGIHRGRMRIKKRASTSSTRAARRTGRCFGEPAA